MEGLDGAGRIVGFIISIGAWRGNNKRYDRLIRYDEKQRKNLP
ncbi:hypothetical protein [Paenibacillus lautus]|nr:hypothetical protein [Paenibacillus lautus]MEC0257394.1 hypothetical protein [Paenibacillus lautus]